MPTKVAFGAGVNSLDNQTVAIAQDGVETPRPRAKRRSAGMAAMALVSPLLLLEAGLVIPVDGPAIENGQVLIRNGKILRVGVDVDLGPAGL